MDSYVTIREVLASLLASLDERGLPFDTVAFRTACDKARKLLSEESAGSASFVEWLDNYFRAMRFDPKHHLGLGDIRLTLGQQTDLLAAAKCARTTHEG